MKKVLVFAVAAIALLGCQKNETVRTAMPGEIRFTSNIQTYSLKATDTAFENNDKVGIFAGTPINKSNVEATVNGTSLVPTTPIKWIEGDNGVVKFYAYYPYAEGAVKAYNFAVQADQSAEASYKKSDLMIASTSSAPKEEAVALPFAHALSKVVINVTNNVPETTISKVTFEGVALGATVDLETAEISNLSTDLANIVANGASGAYQLIVVPQTATPKIRVSLSNNKDYVYELAAAFTFKAGKKATATLVANPKEEANAVEFSLDVTDWAADDPISFNDPSIEDTAVWKVVGLGGDWDNGVAMVEDENHNWSADITYAEGDTFKLKCGEVWVGMQPTWLKYGLGDFGNNTNYLQEGDEAINIVLDAEPGSYHLFFAPDTKWFVVTSNSTPEPAETVTVTVNVNNLTDWTALKLYTWSGSTQPCGAWPGMDPAAEDVVVGEVTFKSFVISGCPKGVEINYILNDGAETPQQTADLVLGTFEVDTTVYLTLKADKTVEPIVTE